MAQLPDIDTGAAIHVKVVKQPTNAAAAKTLVRLLNKDPEAKDNHKRLEAIRRKQYNPRRRGGRLYGGHMVKLRPLKGNVGESGALRATDDVLKDLQSVARFIEVTPA